MLSSKVSIESLLRNDVNLMVMEAKRLMATMRGENVSVAATETIPRLKSTHVRFALDLPRETHHGDHETVDDDHSGHPTGNPLFRYICNCEARKECQSDTVGNPESQSINLVVNAPRRNRRSK